MNKNESVAFMLAIIEIILIGLMFTTENEWVVGFGLVAANFLGLRASLWGLVERTYKVREVADNVQRKEIH
jgi:type IV secretory pathway VirB2 component (pilin)